MVFIRLKVVIFFTWIDPKQDLFVIMLTDRLDYSDRGKFRQFRRDISSIATKEFIAAGGPPGQELQPVKSQLLGSMARPLPIHASSKKIEGKSSNNGI